MFLSAFHASIFPYKVSNLFRGMGIFHLSKRCCGLSHGWLATVDPTTDQGLIIALSNPFTKAKPILLPPLIGRVREYESFYYEHYVHKVILSTDPALNPENYVVVALYHSWFRLVFIKAGQTSWTYLKDGCSYDDVIFYKDQVYAVRQLGAIWSFDVHSSDIKNSSQLELRTPPEPFQDYGFHAYLVESTEGDLLPILRHYELKGGFFKRNNRRTTGFEVYKWELDDEGGSSGHKVELKSIGDQALFVGDNHSISVLASKFPGCQPNSIYYTDDYISGYPLFNGDQACDMGTKFLVLH